MERAPAEERAYFERISRANRALDDGDVPGSLAEMFDRLERSRAQEVREGTSLGSTADGDIAAHLRFLEMARRVRDRGAERS